MTSHVFRVRIQRPMMNERFRASIRLIWPMMPLAMLIHFNIPGKVHTLRSQVGTRTTILLVGHEVL